MFLRSVHSEILSILFWSDEVDYLDTVSLTVLVAMGPKVVDHSQEENWAQFSIPISLYELSVIDWQL